MENIFLKQFDIYIKKMQSLFVVIHRSDSACTRSERYSVSYILKTEFGRASVANDLQKQICKNTGLCFYMQ